WTRWSACPPRWRWHWSRARRLTRVASAVGSRTTRRKARSCSRASRNPPSGARKPPSRDMFDNFRLIDLSVPLENDAVSEPVPAQVRYVRHDAEGRDQLCQLLGVRAEDLVYSEGRGWAVEEVRAITHTGTHVDAPYHY